MDNATQATQAGSAIAAWMADTSNYVDAVQGMDAHNAAAEFVRLDNLSKKIDAEKSVARDAVIATFTAIGYECLNGVILTHSERRTFDHEAAARIDVANLVEPKTSAALVDAAITAGTITPRQYARIVTAAPVVIVQQERKRKP